MNITPAERSIIELFHTVQIRKGVGVMGAETYVVTDVADNVGNFLSKALLRKGHNVRVIGRRTEILQPLIDAGAEAMFGKLDDEEFLIEAFDGASAVFVPGERNIFSESARKVEDSLSEPVRRALRHSEVSRVVITEPVPENTNREQNRLGNAPVSGLSGRVRILNARDFVGRQMPEFNGDSAVAEIAAALMIGEAPVAIPALSSVLDYKMGLAMAAGAGSSTVSAQGSKQVKNTNVLQLPAVAFASGPVSDMQKAVELKSSVSNRPADKMVPKMGLVRSRFSGCHPNCN